MKGLVKKLDKGSIDYIHNHGGFIDAKYGGLVIGKTHGEGGIIIVSPNADGETIDIAAEMEHGEYIMNHEATIKYKDRLSEINADSDFDGCISIDDIRLKRVLFAGKTFAAIVFAYGEQYIINRNSTAKYLDELETMNNECNNIT